MCFWSSPSAKAKVAKTDIVCWKVFARDLIKNQIIIHPVYMSNYTYKLGEVQPIENLEKDDIDDSIRNGYHSYRTLGHAGGWSAGRHHIRECVIPKGATYYSNRDGEYVSSTIIVK